MTKKFENLYFDEMVKMIKLSRPNIPTIEIKKIVNEIIHERSDLLMNRKCKIYNNYNTVGTCVNDTQNNYVYTEPDPEDGKTVIKLRSVINYYIEKKPIMTGFGVMFEQHEGHLNLNALFIEYLMSERDEAKKIQFAGIDEKDSIKESFGEMLQKTMKLLNNSYYGVTGEKNSQFYNPLISPSITYTGYQIITTSIMAFESFLSNNIKYDNLHELITFMQRSLNSEDVKSNILDILDDDKIANKKDVINYIKDIITGDLLSEFNNHDSNVYITISNIIDNLTEEQLQLIYYKNNIYKFLENSKVLSLIKFIVEKDILDPNNLDDKTKEVSDELWSLLEQFVVYDYQWINRASRVYSMSRKSILGCDTDSNFVGLEKYFKFIEDKFKYKDYDINREYGIANSAIVFLAHFIQKELNRFTHNCNLTPVKQPIIRMKSEFLYRKMMFTRNKKQYAGLTKNSSFFSNCWKLLKLT